MNKFSYRILLLLLIILFFIVVTVELAVFFFIKQTANTADIFISPASQGETRKLTDSTDGDAISQNTDTVQVTALLSLALGYSLLHSQEYLHYRQAAIAAGENPDSPHFVLQYSLFNTVTADADKKISFPKALSKAMLAKNKYKDRDIRTLAEFYIYRVEKMGVDEACVKLFGKPHADLTLSESIRFAAYYPQRTASVTGFNSSFIEKCRLIARDLALDGTISAHDKAMCMDEFR